MAIATKEMDLFVRDFLPGACGPTGEAAEIFAEADKQTDIHAPVMSLAQTACSNCLQRTHCEDQLVDIADTLFAREVGFPVVAATVVTEPVSEIRYATRRELLGLEPHYIFDLSKPLPHDSQVATAILRQMLCAKPKLIAGTVPEVAGWAIDEVMKNANLRSFIATLKLTGAEVSQVMLPLVQSVIAHSKQREGVTSEAAFRRLSYDRRVDLRILQMVSPQYLHDAKQIKNMGFTKLEIVAYHGADYWQRVIDAYRNSQCISAEAVIRHCQRQPRNPTSAIEGQIKRTVLRREGRYSNPYTLPAAVKQAEISRLEQELGEEYPYISHAMLQDAFSRSSSVEVAIAKVEALKIPSIKEVVADFKDIITEPALVYAIMHSSDPRQWIADYQKRTETLTDRVAAIGGHVAPSKIAAFALDPFTKDSTGEEVIADTEARTLRRDFSQKCRTYKSKMHVPSWVAVKIVSQYPSEERWDVITNLNELMETNVLQVSHLSCALETEAAEIPGFLEYAVGKQGAYLAFTADSLAQFDSVMRAAIVKRAKLDQLVFGRKLTGNPTPAEVDLPLWLRPAEMAILDRYIRRGARAERILSGEDSIPDAILKHLGAPFNPRATEQAMSAVRTSILRARQARQAKSRVSKRATTILGS